jgi:hypothetical protein
MLWSRELSPQFKSAKVRLSRKVSKVAEGMDLILRVCLFAGPDCDPKEVLRRRKRTGITINVGTIRVVGFVEIEGYRIASGDMFDIEVATTAISFSGTGFVTKGEE